MSRVKESSCLEISALSRYVGSLIFSEGIMAIEAIVKYRKGH
jgi:hypothetical protein